MNRGLVKAILLLPVPVLLVVPAIILYVSRGTILSPDIQFPTQVTFWVAMDILSIGLFLAVWSSHVIVSLGDGTPAPWEPTRKLVISGPYRYIRNPMITGAIFILLGETILFNSWGLFVWAVIFYIGKAIYIPLVEEKGLEQRFGKVYREYKSHVPPWLPRLHAWEGEGNVL